MIKTKIKKLGTIINGGTPSTSNEEYWGGNISWITPDDLSKTDEKWIEYGERNISEEGFKNSSAKMVPPNSILITSRAPVGYVVRNRIQTTTNQGMKSFVPDLSKVDADYMYYYFVKNTDLLNMRSTGTTFKELSKRSLEEIELFVPDIEEQRESGRKISLLDRKIESNNNLINQLDEYAQLLFHKWFIDFNFPNENGKPYKDNGGLIKSISGKSLPVGWDFVELPKLCSVIDCLHSKKPDRVEEANGNVLLQLFNIAEHGLINTRENYYISDEDYELWTSRIEVEGGDLVITNAGRVGAIAQIPEGYKFGIGRNMTAIRPEEIPPTYLYLYFNSSDFRTQVKKNTDSGAFFKSLNVRGIKQLKIIKPEEKLVNMFEKKSRVIRRKIELINIENEKLIQYRDLLIKKLIK